MKVTLLGAAGGIGQTLALLLKLRLPAGTDLALYDISPVTPGIAVDISHIPTSVNAVGYSGEDPSEALKNANLVLLTAGVARKPGMTRADLFNINAGIIKNLVEKVVDIDYNDVLIVVKTSPGAAQLIARLLDSIGKSEGILGTIAGDDTIFITPTRSTTMEDLIRNITELFESSL